jgi:hypothetical protein
MRVISFIQDQEVIEKILKHLGLWLVKPKIPPRANAPPRQLEIDYSDSQVPLSEEFLYKDPDYPIDTYVPSFHCSVIGFHADQVARILQK